MCAAFVCDICDITAYKAKIKRVKNKFLTSLKKNKNKILNRFKQIKKMLKENILSDKNGCSSAQKNTAAAKIKAGKQEALTEAKSLKKTPKANPF